MICPGHCAWDGGWGYGEFRTEEPWPEERWIEEIKQLEDFWYRNKEDKKIDCSLPDELFEI